MNRNVIIAIIMVVLVLLACCVLSCAGVFAFSQAMNLSLGPSDVPVYPGARFAGTSTGMDKIDLGLENLYLSEYTHTQYQAPGHVATDEIAIFYKREMPKDGWTEQPTRRLQFRASYLLKFLKDNGSIVCYIHMGPGMTGKQLIDIYRGRP